ncbi:NDR1/HIN1-like protein 2 [Sesamum indicum]|uniref:NDR1/HIN1-like protein 2 n=1 Tax=Sesamum indicum TaxID=4182 RepID=A0A6I9UNK9_SESIN|nr:NDR1/HIN1-like protein 2 [Sesamum indicum]
MALRKLDRDQLGMYCWFFSVVTVLSMAGVVSWLSLTPKNPGFRVSDARFPDSRNHSMHLNVSVPNNSIIFDLEISNPNKRMGIYYSGINLALFSGGGVVGTNSIPAFYQGYRNTTLFQILIHASQQFWQATNAGKVDFMVRVETAVKFRIIKWKTKLHQISYEEQFRDVNISLNRTVSGGNYAEAKLQNASKVRVGG